ncbi:cadherin domain-containing protein [Hymenobacter busanensis]|uniref:cadherin domain-containing protein n=1 Tax=Hymenobacter busanensis TaxID=2607656 RepID=UPI001366D100|nr:cadherin domain-containing protein [Hymenobacter busanensis]QHJ07978.1 T9SS type A sorting domain-containing protein [Hymenobacter busanensis]
MDGFSNDEGASTTSNTLYSTLTDYSFSIPSVNGSTLYIKIEADYQGGTEELAFDKITITGTATATSAPVLANIETTNLPYSEGQAATQVTNAITITDSDNANLAGATVSIQTNYINGQDVLSYSIPGSSGISTTGFSNGSITFTGTSSLANYQTLLRSITYRNSDATNATGGNRTVLFTVTDGTNTSNGQVRTIAFTTTLNAAAALPYTEDFTTNGEGTRYASNSFVDATLAWVRTNFNPPANPNNSAQVYSPATLSNISNTWYWYGEGTQNLSNPDPLKIGTLQLAPVNATNYGSLVFNVRLGTGQAAQWETDDNVKFYYRVGAGSWVLFGAFYGNGSSELQRDADLNGTPDGVTLNSALQNVALALPTAVTGASVDFKIELSCDGQEEFAMDLIQVTGTLNNAPTISSQTRTVAENAANGNNVGAVVTASDPDAGQTLTYSITAGNTGGAFAINASSGQITVANSAQLNFEATPSYALTVQVADNGIPSRSASATVTVNLTNVNEAPSISSQTFSINENSANGTTVGTVAASDPDAGTTLTFSITAGNTGGAFTFVGNSLQVANAAALDFETTPTFALTVQVSDGALTSSATVTVNLNDVDDTRPSVSISSSAGASGSTTTTSPIPFTVTFSENVSGFVAGDVTVTNGSITGGVVNGTSPGTTYTFTVTPATPGTATTVNVPANVVQDAASNFNTAAPAPYSLTYSPPSTTVTSVTRLTPSPTATAQVSYRVVFASSVTGVTTSNFSVSSNTGATVFSVSGSGTTYTVVVNTGTGDGTLTLNVQNTSSISPTVTNVPYTAGETYTIIKSFPAAPTLRIQAAGSASGNGDVTAFVDVVQVLQSGTSTVVPNGLQNGSFETNNVPAASYLYAPSVVASPWSFGTQAGVSRNGSSFGSTAAAGDAVALLQSANGNNGSMSQALAVPTGSYQVSFQAIQRAYTSRDQVLNVYLFDGANNVLIGTIQPNSTPTYEAFTSATFSVTAPALTATVSSPAAATGGTTGTTPIPFSVSFSQSVGTSFTAADVTVTGGSVVSASFSGSGAGPYTFNATPATPGTATTVSLGAGVAQDANSTLNSASNSYSVTFVRTAAPVVTTPTNGATVASNLPTYSGTAAAGSTVTVYVDATNRGTTTADASGNWTLVHPSNQPLTVGGHTVYATAQLSGQGVSANSNTNNFIVPNPATYTSSAASQVSTARVLPGSTNQAILQVAVVIGGGPDLPLSAQSFSFTTTGTTAVANIDAARVFYTGTSSTFATTTAFGSAVVNPNGAFAISGSQQLSTGTNYFWLVYDVDASAPNGNLLDATATGLTIGGTAYAPTNPAPAGSRQVLRTSRVAGDALRFNGTNGYIELSATTPAPNFSSAYTQEVWVKPQTGTGNTLIGVLGQEPAGGQNQRSPYIAISTRLALEVGFGTGTALRSINLGNNSLTAGVWYHIVARYDGTNLTLFVDGLQRGNDNAAGSPVATPVRYVGSLTGTAGGSIFQGDIDEVRQWNKALDLADIRRRRHLTLNGLEDGLVSYLQFNDTGTTTTDMVSGAVGTFNGSVARTSSTAPVGYGTSSLVSVTGNGPYTFPGTNVAINFTSAGTTPYDVVVSRLEGKPQSTQPTETGLQRTFNKAYWIVNRYSSSSFSANITYTLSSVDISPADANSPSNLKLFKRASNSDGAFDASIPAASANAATGTVTFNGITSFSQTVIGTFGSSPLPVELLEFAVERKGTDALLRWATASEKNNARFEVEVSLDGKNFTQIGSKEGYGSTSQRHDYQFVDAQLSRYATALLYYRLRQIDTDGQFSLSPVRTLQVEGAEPTLASASPNPFGETLQVRLTAKAAGPATLTLYDAVGRPVLTQRADLNAGPNVLPLVMGRQLPTGLYSLSIQHGGKRTVLKVLHE